MRREGEREGKRYEERVREKRERGMYTKLSVYAVSAATAAARATDV